MANLYEIDQGILECIDKETGELIDPDRLSVLYMERNQKIENVALWIKNLQADAQAYKAEKDAFAERERAANNKIASLKKWLAEALNGQRFDSARCAVSFRKSTKLEVVDEYIIPNNLMVRTVTFRPEATLIKELLKQGQEVPGCRLVENLNTQIK